MMDDRDIERIAQRVAEVMREDAPDPFPARGLVDVDQVAQLLQVQRDWVYENQTKLGAVRIGEGRGRLRFDARSVLAYLDERRITERSSAPRRRAGRPRRGGATSFDLLPIPDSVR